MSLVLKSRKRLGQSSYRVVKVCSHQYDQIASNHVNTTTAYLSILYQAYEKKVYKYALRQDGSHNKMTTL